MKRTHSCGQLCKEEIGQKVSLCGWVSSRRDHGGLIFIDLRDRDGLTQVVFNPKVDRMIHEKAHAIRNEYVLGVGGKVMNRPEN